MFINCSRNPVPTFLAAHELWLFSQQFQSMSHQITYAISVSMNASFITTVIAFFIMQTIFYRFDNHTPVSHRSSPHQIPDIDYPM